MKNVNKHILCVRTPEINAEFNVPWDASIDEYFNAFRAAMVALTFSEEQVDMQMLQECYDRGLIEDVEEEDDEDYDQERV